MGDRLGSQWSSGETGNSAAGTMKLCQFVVPVGDIESSSALLVTDRCSAR